MSWPVSVIDAVFIACFCLAASAASVAAATFDPSFMACARQKMRSESRAGIFARWGTGCDNSWPCVCALVSTTCPTRRSAHVTIFARAVLGFLPIRSGKPFAAPLPTLCNDWSGGRPICKPGRTAHGLVGSIVIYCRQAKQIPSADAFPRKPSPSSLNQSARTDEFSSAAAQAGSSGSTSHLDRRGGSSAVTRGAQLARTGIAGCRRASIEGKKLIRHWYWR